jgi:hypothetical protein
VLDYIKGRKLVVFMNYMVETALGEVDLYRQTLIMRTISDITGEKFYPWKIEDLQDWWNARIGNYQSWPKQAYYAAKSSFEEGVYQGALTLFQKLMDADSGSEKSRALAIACAIELGKIELANQFLASFINPNSRWELWAKAKISLATEETPRGTEMLADISTTFKSFPERAYIHKGAHIWRTIDWALYNKLIETK